MGQKIRRLPQVCHVSSCKLQTWWEKVSQWDMEQDICDKKITTLDTVGTWNSNYRHECWLDFCGPALKYMISFNQPLCGSFSQSTNMSLHSVWETQILYCCAPVYISNMGNLMNCYPLISSSLISNCKDNRKCEYDHNGLKTEGVAMGGARQRGNFWTDLRNMAMTL